MERHVTIPGRVLAVWVLMIIVETLHGTLRVLLIEPAIGGIPARQISVFTGSVLIFVLTLAFIRWISVRGTAQLLAVGGVWVLLTVAFEISLGRFAMGFSWDRLISDYNILEGGLMPIGLAAMFLAPLAAAKIRGVS